MMGLDLCCNNSMVADEAAAVAVEEAAKAGKF